MLMIGNSPKDFPFRSNIDSAQRRRFSEIHESGSSDRVTWPSGSPVASQVGSSRGQALLIDYLFAC